MSVPVPLTDSEMLTAAQPASTGPRPLTDAEMGAAPAPGLWESFGRGAVEGATFGFDDELGAQDREARERSRRANPWTHFMGELTGSIVPMAAAAVLPTGAGQVAAGGRAAQLASRGAGLVRSAFVPGETATLGQAALQGAKLGAVYGGLSGAGHTDTTDNPTLGSALTERAGNALVGTTIGGALGAPLGVAGHAVSGLAQRIAGARAAAAAETEDASRGALVALSRGLERDRITPDDIITAIRAEFPDDTAAAGMQRRFWGDLQNRQPITADDVEQTVRLAMQGYGPDEISMALGAARPGQVGPGPTAVQSMLDELATRHLGPLNLVDRAALARTGSGQNTQMTMRAAAATPSEATSLARENLLERQIGAGGRLQQLMDRMVGSTDFEGVVTRHSDDLARASSRAYASAFANEVPFDLRPIFNNWERRFETMRGVIPDTIRQRLGAMTTEHTLPNGNVVRVPPVSLEGFMYAREGLRDIIGELPKGNNLRRHLTQFYNEMTDEVARTNPRWAEANQIYRDGMAGREALEAGQRMASRLNTRSRESLAVFRDATTEASRATAAVKAAQTPVNAATKKGVTPTPQQQAALDTAQARLEAAESRLNLFRVGLVRALNDALMNKSETANLTRELLLPGSRQMLRQILGNDQAEQFFRVLQAEASMARTYQSQFGSQTTPLREAIDDLNWAPRFEAAWSNLGLGKVLQLASEYAARNINNARNQQLMRLYTEVDPLKQVEILRAAQNVHAARTNAHQLVGVPAISSPAAVADATMSFREPAIERRRPVPVPNRP